MIKKYIEHMQSQPPHQRRQHAARIATAVTAVVFVGWLASLGVRATHQPAVASSGTPSATTQFANAISGLNTPATSNNTLEVSTSTSY